MLSIGLCANRTERLVFATMNVRISIAVAHNWKRDYTEKRKNLQGGKFNFYAFTISMCSRRRL